MRILGRRFQRMRTYGDSSGDTAKRKRDVVDRVMRRSKWGGENVVEEVDFEERDEK